MEYLFWILLALVGGIAVTLQGQFMGIMDQGIGTRESVFITYAGGGLMVTILIPLPDELARTCSDPWLGYVW